MSNNGQNVRPQGAPQQQLSPPTDPRKRNIPPQRARTSGLRQIEKYSAMPMTAPSPSGPEHPPMYGYVPQPAPQPAPPPPSANVMAFRDVLLMPPPPPPPLPPLPAPAPPLATTAPVPPMYTAPSSVAPTFSGSHQIPKEFDPTQPPPILRPPLNASRKRGAPDMPAGPPSKIRLMELPDGPCADCVQRNIRTSIYDDHNSKVEQEFKISNADFNTNTENLENGKLWLRSILTPRQYLRIENYIENSVINDFFSDPSPSSSFASLFQETPVAPRQSLVQQLMEVLIGGARNINSTVTQQQPTFEDSLVQMLSGGGRRSSAAESSLEVLLEAISVGSSSAEPATTSSSPDRLHAVMEALRPAAESEQRGPSERAAGSSNGLSRLANGGITSAPSTPAPYVRRSGQAGGPSARPYYTQQYPPPVPAPGPGTSTQPAPLPPYYAHQSQQQPAARPIYAPRYAPGAPQPPAPLPPAQQFAPPYYASARPPLPDQRSQPPSNQYPHFGPPYPPYYPTAPTGPTGPSGPPY